MPLLSVILPVYNGERYLREAIDSMLAQTFTDFELLVLDDGSTDGSAAIIQSYTDPRIQYVRNTTNEGLIFTLNRGIDLATGELLARMDADDVALPERLERQVSHLEANPAIDILATRVKLIDAEGRPLPDWEDDANILTKDQIRKALPVDNCLAHPTVAGRTELFRRYRYQADQKYSEDYDLWLRLLADGRRIEKLTEPLLLHRILPTSATRFKKVNVFARLAAVKFRFLWPQLRRRRFSAFHARVLAQALADLARAGGKSLKALFRS